MAEFGIHPYYTAPSPAADLVLVHGLMGNSTGTWTGEDKAGKSTFWPDWIKAQCPSVNIWLVDYDSSLNAWVQPAMPLDSIAGAVLSHAKDQRLGSRPIHWVGHSMGGLVIKHLLRQSREKANPDWQKLSDSTAAITFLGTPHHGSSVANWESYFSAFLGAADFLAGTGGAATGVFASLKNLFRGGDRRSHIEQLRAHGQELGSLNDSFAQWLGAAFRRGSLRTVRNYFEELPVSKAVYVVPKHSAQLANALVEEAGVQANHFDICKFASQRSPVFFGLLSVTQSLLGTQANTPSAAASTRVAPASSPQAASKPEPTAHPPSAASGKPTQDGRDRTDMAWRRALKACSPEVQTAARAQLSAKWLSATAVTASLEDAIETTLSEGKHAAKLGMLRSHILVNKPPVGLDETALNQLTRFQLMLLVHVSSLLCCDHFQSAEAKSLCLPDDRNRLAIAVAGHVIFGHGVELSLGADGVQVNNLIDAAALVDESAQAPGQTMAKSALHQEIQGWLRRVRAGKISQSSNDLLLGFLEGADDVARPLLLDRDGSLITPAGQALVKELGMGVVQMAADGRPSHIGVEDWTTLCDALAFNLQGFGQQSSTAESASAGQPFAGAPASSANAQPNQQQEQVIQVNVNQSFTGPVGQSNVTTGANSPIHAQYAPAAAASPSSTIPVTLAFAKLDALLSDAHEKDALHELRDLVMERETSNSAQRRLPKLMADLQRRAQGRAEVTAAWSQLQTLMVAHWPELQTLLR
jgi:pimeloyl-ACP methyl ester carboxylesterase